MTDAAYTAPGERKFPPLCPLKPRNLVVASEIRLNKPPEYDAFIACLESEGYFRRNKDAGNNEETFVPRTIYFGVGPAVPVIPTNRAEEMYRSYDAAQEIDPRRRYDFLGHFGRW